jgi:hypothetical protein
VAKRERGVCRMCGCSHFDPCPEGCGWADVQETLCTECAPIAKAESQALRAFGYRGAELEAFHRGYIVGWFRIRKPRGANPYKQSNLVYAWNRGHNQGADGGRIFRQTFGPVLNFPRPFVYQRPRSGKAAA